jgi:YD repeat-containing protein
VENANGYMLTRPDGGNERYDAAGRIQSETDAAGQTITYTYDGSGYLQRVTDAFGRALTFGYDDASGRLATLTDPAGQQTQYGYDAKSNLQTVTYPDGTAKIYYYESTYKPHSLTGIAYVDSSGTITRFSTFGYGSGDKTTFTQLAVPLPRRFR